MKKSQLKQIIKEEIRKVLSENENDFKSFLSSLNIDLPSTKSLDRGIDIGSDVATIGYGPGVVIYIDDEKRKYTVDIGNKTVVVPFKFVQPITARQSSSKSTNIQSKLLDQIRELETEHKQFTKSFISNLADFNSSNYEEDFKNEKWKLSSIAEFYLDLGQQMWGMFKTDYEYITHSDEFEDLFLDILWMLKHLKKYDKGEDDDLNDIVQSYEKIGDKIGAGTI